MDIHITKDVIFKCNSDKRPESQIRKNVLSLCQFHFRQLSERNNKAHLGELRVKDCCLFTFSLEQFGRLIYHAFMPLCREWTCLCGNDPLESVISANSEKNVVLSTSPVVNSVGLGTCTSFSPGALSSFFSVWGGEKQQQCTPSQGFTKPCVFWLWQDGCRSVSVGEGSALTCPRTREINPS